MQDWLLDHVLFFKHLAERVGVILVVKATGDNCTVELDLALLDIVRAFMENLRLVGHLEEGDIVYAQNERKCLKIVAIDGDMPRQLFISLEHYREKTRIFYVFLNMKMN